MTPGHDMPPLDGPSEAAEALGAAEALRQRVRLPDRRPSVPQPFTWCGVPWLVTVGFDADGVARECFLDCCSGQLDAGFVLLAQDAAILISQHLQRGVRPQALRAWLSRPGLAAAHPQQSLLGCLAGQVELVERRDAAAMREAYRLAAGAPSAFGQMSDAGCRKPEEGRP